MPAEVAKSRSEVAPAPKLATVYFVDKAPDAAATFIPEERSSEIIVFADNTSSSVPAEIAKSESEVALVAKVATVELVDKSADAAATTILEAMSSDLVVCADNESMLEIKDIRSCLQNHTNQLGGAKGDQKVINISLKVFKLQTATKLQELKSAMKNMVKDVMVISKASAVTTISADDSVARGGSTES